MRKDAIALGKGHHKYELYLFDYDDDTSTFDTYLILNKEDASPRRHLAHKETCLIDGTWEKRTPLATESFNLIWMQ
jgi:hypothetical protein